jgi:hypothetical protein
MNRTVWLGIVVPAPDSISRPERVERVFASEDDARRWCLEGPAPSMNGSYRRYERHEVIPKSGRDGQIVGSHGAVWIKGDGWETRPGWVGPLKVWKARRYARKNGIILKKGYA